MSAKKGGSLSRKRRSSDRPKQLQFAVCEATGKRGYFSKRDARTARARHHQASSLSVFRCDACGHVHLGHLPLGVRVGMISRSAYKDAARARADAA